MKVKYKMPVIKSSYKKKFDVLKNFRNFKLTKRKILKIILILFVAIVVLRLVILIGSKFGRKKIETVSAIPVEVIEAKKDKIRDILYLTGRLEAESEVQVFSPVSGWLDRLYVDIGSKVRKRSIVASIDRNIIGSEYTKALVQSPISGEVGKIFIDVGTTVAPNTPIMTIVNYDTIKVNLDIPEKYITRVKVNDPVLITTDFTNEEFIGKIERKSETIDSLTGTFKAKVTIPNKLHKLRPGAFAKIKIIMEEKNSIVISKDALIEFEEERPFVYKVTNGIAKKVYIETGITEDEKVEILKGLEEGNIVITTGKEIVFDGAKVKIAGGLKWIYHQ